MESILRKVVWLFREQPVIAYSICGCISAVAITWGTLKLTATDVPQFSLEAEASGSAIHERVDDAWKRAQKSGVLQPLSASATIVNESGIPFMLTTLDAKAQTAKSGPSSRGTGRTDAFAFIPSRQVIALLDKTHKLLFNKFFVTPKHLVAVTSTFQPQEQPLSVLDMRVAWALVQAQEGVAFYNGGFSSGASQPRRHLQYIAYADLAQSMGESVRSTLHSSGASVPLDAAVASYRSSRAWCGPAAGESFQLPALPFEHQMWLHGGDLNRTDASSAASALHGRYSSALEAYTRVHGGQSGGPWDGSHNLLLTPSYMLLVPRGKEHALTGQRVSINALGYLGMVLCRPEESVDLRSMGLMQALRACALQAKA